MKATPAMRSFIRTIRASCRPAAARAAERAFFDAYRASLEVDIEPGDAVGIGEAAAIDAMKVFI